MIKKEVNARFEAEMLKKDRLQERHLEKGSNGVYSYQWLRDLWEGWLLCAINSGQLQDTEKNRHLSVNVSE